MAAKAHVGMCSGMVVQIGSYIAEMASKVASVDVMAVARP